MDVKLDSLKISPAVINFDSPYRKFIGRNDYDENSVILGRGAYGIVVRASYKNRNVAVKILEKSNYFKYQSLHQEANILNLSHKNIIKILKIVDCKTYGAIIMERFDGKSLQHVLDRYEIDTWHRLQILTDVASALAYLHNNKIVHSDVKPQNVFISIGLEYANGYMCKLFDFGCSLTLNSSYEHFGGTARYCAPEVLIGGRPDYSSDIFSMGIIMWQLKTNKIPYGLTLANETIIYNVVKEDMRPDSLKELLLISKDSKSSSRSTSKFDSPLLRTDRIITLSLTPVNNRRNFENIPELCFAKKPSIMIGKSLHGSLKKNSLSNKKYYCNRRKLFGSKLSGKIEIHNEYEDDLDTDLKELFVDNQLKFRSLESVSLVEKEYQELYKRCWDRDTNHRYEATEVINIIKKLICLL